MLAFLVKRPIGVIMSFLGLTIVGAVVSMTLPVSLLPDIQIPRISVQINYPNTTARTLENTVVRPLRNQLLQVGRLEDISSVTRNESALLSLVFPYGTTTDLAAIEVNEKIDQVMASLPRDLPRPRVVPADLSDIPVFYVSVQPAQPNSALIMELSDLARNALRQRMEQLAEVAFVDISGTQEAEIAIIPDHAVMQSLGLTEGELTRILQDNNVELGNLLLREGSYQYNVRFSDVLHSVQGVKDIYFQHAGRLLQIKDVATVERRTRPVRGYFLHSGEGGIVFSIRKKAGAQLFSLQESMQELLLTLRQEYPNLRFTVTNDQSAILRASIDNLLSSLGYGAFFAFLVLFLFFREWRAPLLIGLAVPLTLIIVLLGFYLVGLSINVISLAGLVLGVGLMIDNSIIVVENIRQYRQEGLPITAACVEGGNEVIRPLLSSALTTCAVFLPLIFLSGLAGALFYDQAISVTIALGVSLLLAFILLPTLARLIERRNLSGSRQTDPSWRRFDDSVDRVLDYKYLVLLLVLLWLALGGLVYTQIDKRSFPDLSHEAYVLDVDWNEPISVEENRERTLQIVAQSQSFSQGSDAYVGEKQFVLELGERSINQLEMILYLREDIAEDEWQDSFLSHLRAKYPTAIIRLHTLPNLFDQVFLSQAAPLVATVSSNRSQEMPDWSVYRSLEGHLQNDSIRLSAPARSAIIQMSVNDAQVLRNGLTPALLLSQIRTLFNANQISQLRDGNQYLPIILAEEAQATQAQLATTLVRNQDGQAIPLSPLIQLDQQEDYKFITADESGEVLQLDIAQYNATTVESIRNWQQQNPGVSVQFAGQYFEDQERLRELIIVLLVSLLLLYLILAAQFESFSQPLIVLLSVPLSLVGSLVVLYLFGQSLNLISVIGMIVTSGIVVNDAILKVDMINRFRAGGMSLRAAIHKAGHRRIQAILMTSLTTMLALLPILFADGLGAEIQRPLAFAVLGGLTVGTLASLYFIPILYGFLRGKAVGVQDSEMSSPTHDTKIDA